MKLGKRDDGHLGWAVAGLGTLAAFSLVAEFGFDLGERWEGLLDILDVVIAGLFGLELLIALVLTRMRSLRERWYEYALLIGFGTVIGVLRWGTPSDALLPLLGELHLESVTKLYLVFVQLFVLFGVLVRALRSQELLLARDIRPERLFAGGFALLIILGTLALLLPRSSADPQQPIGVLDAFFTATSAVCVTGLAVRDTGADFSTIGQLAIVFLFQVGGLGIATFVAWLSVASGRGFSVPQNLALRELVNARSLADVRRHVVAIVLTAFAIEAVGAVVLFVGREAATETFVERLHWSVFHSISAFCNAGFALQGDSLEGFRASWTITGTIMVLIVIGGLGAPVVRECLAYVAGWRPRGDVKRALSDGRKRPRLSVQSRISLWVTGILIVMGAALFAVCEARGVLAGRSPVEWLQLSLFQSVTTRTAGFDTIPMGDLADATLVVLIVLMVIGASPVSTGGGIKTVAVGVLFATLRAMVRGRDVEAFGRTIPVTIVRASVSVFLTYVILAVGIVFALSVTDPLIGMRERVFEAVSALSTVGLSTGVTAQWSVAGKIVLCLAMFAGRVGPLTMAITVFRSRPAPAYHYPEESLVLG
jgi:trk system potassium uptake protein TrkH